MAETKDSIIHDSSNCKDLAHPNHHPVTVSGQPAGKYRVEVRCKHCGKHGSLPIDPKTVEWT